MLRNEFNVHPAALCRRLPVGGRLWPLCLALLLALPVSSRAVDHVEQEERRLDTTPAIQNPITDLESNQPLIVPSGVTIRKNPTDTPLVTTAVYGLGATTNVGLDNKGVIGGVPDERSDNAFVVDSIFKALNSGTIEGDEFNIRFPRYGMRANAGDITILRNETASATIRGQRAVSARGEIGELTNKGHHLRRGRIRHQR